MGENISDLVGSDRPICITAGKKDFLQSVRIKLVKKTFGWEEVTPEQAIQEKLQDQIVRKGDNYFLTKEQESIMNNYCEYVRT